MNKTYHKQHQCCPKCGGQSITSTHGGYIGAPPIDCNNAVCDCGWRGIVHDLAPEKQGTTEPQQAEEPLTITSLFFALKRRESILSEERTRARLVKYRLLVKEYLRLVQNRLSSLDLTTLQTALMIVTRIKEIGDKTPTDDEIEMVSLLCGTNHDIPPHFWALHNALHGKPEEA